MTLRRTTRLSMAVVTAALLATTACTSGITNRSGPSSSSAAVESSPAFPSESVPPGVEKDSVLDLNSTKDMTGVVTTVSFADSPYAAHLPDICTFIPDSVMQQLGVETKRRGFRGTQLISQACTMFHLESGNIAYSVTANFYTNNIQELLNPRIAVTLKKNISIAPKIQGFVNKLNQSGPDDTNFRQECGTAWGTFFGAIVIRYKTSMPQSVDPCARSVDAARTIAAHMPASPSQMRAAP